METIEPAATVPTSKRPGIALAVICAVVGLLNLLLLDPAIDVLTTHHPPASRPEGGDEAGKALTERVILVVLSGVGVTQLSAPEDPWRFAQLRRRAGEGSFGTAQSVQPSGDAPTWAALLSGASPASSGIIDSNDLGPLAVPSIFDRLRDVGKSSAIVSSQVAWNARAGLAEPDRLVVVASATGVADRAAVVLRERMESLVVVLIDVGRVRRFGHETPWSLVDQQLDVVATVVDPMRDTLIVTADHGLLPDGSSGGHEGELIDIPLVLWGRAILSGRLEPADQRDVVATVATLLGFSYPPYGGRPLLNALDLTEAARAGELVRLLRIRAAGAHVDGSEALPVAHLSLVDAQRALGESDWTGAMTAAEMGLATLDRPPPPPWYLTSSWVWGLALPLVLLAVGRLVAQFRSSLHHLRIPVAGLVAYFVVWSTIYFGFEGKRVSLSAVYGTWRGALSEIALWSGLALITVAVAVGLRNSGKGPLSAAMRTGWTAVLGLLFLTIFFAMFLLLGAPEGQYVAYLLASIDGTEAPTELPDIHGWTILLLAMAQASGIGLAAPAGMLVAAMVADVTARGR